MNLCLDPQFSYLIYWVVTVLKYPDRYPDRSITCLDLLKSRKKLWKYVMILSPDFVVESVHGGEAILKNSVTSES